MKEAYRVYSKNKKISHKSPAFSSTVNRTKIIEPEKRKPGPGQYDVSLPLVKPRYQAIYKNNRSIIIKVNDTPTAAFISRQPRFKQFGTIESQGSLQENQNKSKEDPFFEKGIKRFVIKMPRKGSNQRFSSNLSTEFRTQHQHIRKSKGTNWSKYVEKRNLWNQSSNERSPGPGSYNAQGHLFERNISNNDTSWQFKSITKRSSKQLKNNKSDLLEDSDQVIAIHSRANL